MSFVNYQSQIVPGRSNLDISQQNIQRMNDRKDHLVSEFQMYPGNKFQVQFNQLAKYLDKKVNKQYDRQVLMQLYESSKKTDGIVTIDTFINQTIETEDLVQFRIEQEMSNIENIKFKINELQKQQQNKLQRLKKNEGQMGTLNIVIMNAISLEPVNDTDPVNSFVIIRYGNQSTSTKVINNSLNPIWNEPISIPINMGISEVYLIVSDLRRQQTNDVIGQIKIQLDQCTDQQKLVKRSYLINPKNNLRSTSELKYQIQYMFNDVKQIDQQIKVLDQDIHQYLFSTEKNRKLLQILQEPYYNQNNNFLMKAFNSPSKYNQQYNHMSPNDYQNKKHDQKNTGFKKYGLMFFMLMGIYLVLSLVLSMYRTQFLDLTIILLVMSIINTETEELYFQDQHMKISCVMVAVSIVLDIIWLIIFTTGWTKAIDMGMNNNLKLSLIVISYIHAVFKLFFLLLDWKVSLDFDIFKIQIRKVLNF